MKVFAQTAEDAAVKAGRQADLTGDYEIVRGYDATFHVRRYEKDGNYGEEKMYVVTGKSEPHYSAREKE